MEERLLKGVRGDDLEGRVQAMLNAPAGCAFLAMVAQSGLTPQAATRPAFSVYAAALAVGLVDIRHPNHGATVAHLLEECGRHEALARSLLQQTAAWGWFAPLNPSRQVWVSAEGVPPDADRFVPPCRPVDRWDCHAQKPKEGFYTSTLIGDVASVLAAIDLRIPDFDYRLPSAWWHIECDASARVYEIDGPAAWHALCLQYPAYCEDGRIVPDWAAVAEDWDGVHLSLGGLLTSEQVRVETQEGWSRHWGWHAEQTVWLRWRCTTADRLPDRDRRQAPAELNRLWPKFRAEDTLNRPTPSWLASLDRS